MTTRARRCRGATRRYRRGCRSGFCSEWINFFRASDRLYRGSVSCSTSFNDVRVVIEFDEPLSQHEAYDLVDRSRQDETRETEGATGLWRNSRRVTKDWRSEDLQTQTSQRRACPSRSNFCIPISIFSSASQKSQRRSCSPEKHSMRINHEKHDYRHLQFRAMFYSSIPCVSLSYCPSNLRCSGCFA